MRLAGRGWVVLGSFFVALSLLAGQEARGSLGVVLLGPLSSGESRGAVIHVGVIEGFTTQSHVAPHALVVPTGVPFNLEARAIDGSLIPSARWFLNGSYSGESAVMQCSFDQRGVDQIAVLVPETGELVACELRPEELTPDRLRVAYEVDPVRPFDLTEDATNEQTVGAFWDPVSAVTPIVGGFATSRDREVYLSARAGFAGRRGSPKHVGVGNDVRAGSLVEWRVDGVAVGLGGVPFSARHPGLYRVEAGPPTNPARFDLVFYETEIVTADVQSDGMPERELTFYALTNPPGYEDLVTWLASTKYGSAEPTLGTGAVFTTTFFETTGPGPQGQPWQWAGVRADDALLANDANCTCTIVCVDEDPNVGAPAELDIRVTTNPPKAAGTAVKVSVDTEDIAQGQVLGLDANGVFCRNGNNSMNVAGYASGDQIKVTIGTGINAISCTRALNDFNAPCDCP